MNDDQHLIDTLNKWNVETSELRGRIHDRLADSEPWQLVLDELRRVRIELSDLRRENKELTDEVRRLTSLVSKHSPFRLSPFTTEDHRITLS